MNRKQKLADDVPAREEMELHSMLSTELPPLDAAPDLLGSIQQRLGGRIAASIARHAGLTTVRARDGLWKNLAAGIRYKQLWQSRQGNSVLIEFAPGAALPVHRHLYQEEGIVLGGSLQHEGETLQLFDYHLSPAGSQHGRISSTDGALAFLRGSSLGDKVAMTKEMLGGMLPKSHKDSISIFNQAFEWDEIQPGISQTYLCRDGKAASRYLKLEPGATLSGEKVPCFEECMMLNGEAFFGDILLQAGDYQTAASGVQGLEIFTDTGAMFFIRGV